MQVNGSIRLIHSLCNGERTCCRDLSTLIRDHNECVLWRLWKRTWACFYVYIDTHNYGRYQRPSGHERRNKYIKVQQTIWEEWSRSTCRWNHPAWRPRSRRSHYAHWRHTLLTSHIRILAEHLEAGAAAKKAASLKNTKYSDITFTHVFYLIAIETAGFWDTQATELIEELGRRITEAMKIRKRRHISSREYR